MRVEGVVPGRYDARATAGDYRRQVYRGRSGAGGRGACGQRNVAARPPRPARPSVRRPRPKRFVAFALVALVLLVGAVSVFSYETQGGAPVSTPMSQWKKGEMPYLYQTDAQWANKKYAGDTIGISGCGPTCLSMVYVMLTGDKDYGPVQMARFSEKNGFVMDGATAWALMTDGASELGISGREIPADATVVKRELKQGHPVICSMRPGDFTTTGHFIALAGMDDNGHVRVHDPNSVANSKKGWDLDTVLEQCKGIWAFST